jgi:hypothetical protein
MIAAIADGYLNGIIRPFPVLPISGALAIVQRKPEPGFPKIIYPTDGNLTGVRDRGDRLQ